MTRRYSVYKDSGVEWLGEVPKHWVISQSRRLFAERKERARPEDKQLTASQKMGIITQEEFISVQGTRVMQVISGSDILKHVEPNDFVISMRSFEGGLEHSLISGCISSAYVMIIPSPSVHPGFFKYAFKSTTYIQALQSTTNLVRDGQALRYDNFCNVLLGIPPLSEQRAIAAFLDRETAKIDALVVEQRRLIELLKEKRQAVISHAVTKGLDPAAPMKDSGVEWLGEVPAHWDVKAVWMLFALGRGRVLSHQDIADQFGPYPVYSSQTENDGQMGTIDTYDFEGAYLTWTTDGANAGTVFERSGRFSCTNVCGTLKPRTNVDLQFFESALNEATGYFVRHDINPKLMNNVMSKIRLPVPSNEEQNLITEFVKSQTGHFGSLIFEVEAAIALLQERRSALISAAVTGKIDVRGFVPAEAEVA